MIKSRQIWGWIVFAIGLLWLTGGIFGALQRRPGALVFVFCGLVLARMGHTIRRGDPSK